MLAPGAVSTAVPHNTYGLSVYTVMWNVIDVSAPRRKAEIPPAANVKLRSILLLLSPMDLR